MSVEMAAVWRSFRSIGGHFLLESLGFIINWAKSFAIPTQFIEYLGIVVNSIDMSFALPERKVILVRDVCKKALEANTVSLRIIASILGNFNWAIPTIPFAQSHYRSMQRFYISESKKAQGNLSVRRVLPLAARVDLEWWLANLDSVNGKKFFPKVSDVEICSDASLSGWGSVCNGVTARGPWTWSDSARQINELELLGALFSLETFLGDARELSVRLYLDNTTAAVHLAGVLNVVADRESRSECDSSDWMLCRNTFDRINGTFPSRTDLFSLAWNAQLPNFFSWGPQPGAAGVNAIAPASRLEIIQKSFHLQGFSKPLVNILAPSATHAAYGSAWRSWADWCLRRSENPLSPPLGFVLEVLASLHTEEKAYSTINVYRSMLSSTLPHIDNRPIGQHPLVKSLMSGCYNINPPKPKYNSIWDPELVVRFVSVLGENSRLSIKNLTLKTVTLIALASLLRVSEMAAISTDSLVFSDSSVKFSLFKPRKAQHNGALQVLFISLLQEKLCYPVCALESYIERTGNSRAVSAPSHVFIALISPFREVSSNTISSWIKCFIGSAGVDTSVFSAHSTRGAAVSKAATSGLSIDAILRAGCWAAESTFSRFYRRESVSSVAAAVLNNSIEQGNPALNEVVPNVAGKLSNIMTSYKYISHVISRSPAKIMSMSHGNIPGSYVCGVLLFLEFYCFGVLRSPYLTFVEFYCFWSSTVLEFYNQHPQCPRWQL
ncbi:Uncharacterized protein APZ42_015524 [Daphnia magna]|uniref:Tyr recombinase domain-containing protein n=1 Tax=Daphnia magna TaxID=35525 RepID=A0A162NWD6_9CRUS|nr:Uncharacterized protein APZ42_015524 [Daphnia magna]